MPPHCWKGRARLRTLDLRMAREPLARAARVQAARARRPRGPCVPLFGGDFLLRPPPAAGTACSRHSCAPQVWIPAGIIFAPPLQLHDGPGASTLQVRPRPPAAAVRPRKSRLLTPRQLVRARRVRLHLWAPRRSTSSGADGAGGCVGGRSRRRRVRRCGRRSPTAYPASSARICAQNRPRRRAASPRGASVCLSCVV